MRVRIHHTDPSTHSPMRKCISPGNGTPTQKAHYLVLALEVLISRDFSQLIRNFPWKICDDAAKGAPRQNETVQHRVGKVFWRRSPLSLSRVPSPLSSAPLPIYIFWKTCWATHHRTAHHIVLNYRIIHTEFRISRASKFCICRTCCNATWDAVATIHAQHTNVSEKIPRP